MRTKQEILNSKDARIFLEKELEFKSGESKRLKIPVKKLWQMYYKERIN